MTAITGSVPPSPRGKALVREENLQTKIIRLGFDSPSRLFFFLFFVSDSACSNACLRLSTRATVRSADWVKRHACGLPTAAAVAETYK